jgi:hypothetical protein
MYTTFSVTLQGVSPLIMHNGRLADPFEPITKAMKKISAQRHKTDADLEELARLEWYGGLYLQDGAPCIPGEVLEAHILDAAKKRRMGPQAKAGLYCDGNFPLLYDGPQNPDALWEDPAFRYTVPARVQRSRVMRTRPIFLQWGVRFTVTFNDGLLNQPDIIDLLHLGGEQIGLCERRPKYGRYLVVDNPD